MTGEIHAHTISCVWALYGRAPEPLPCLFSLWYLCDIRYERAHQQTQPLIACGYFSSFFDISIHTTSPRHGIHKHDQLTSVGTSTRSPEFSHDVVHINLHLYVVHTVSTPCKYVLMPLIESSLTLASNQYTYVYRRSMCGTGRVCI